jgi:hypothetical protein
MIILFIFSVFSLRANAATVESPDIQKQNVYLTGHIGGSFSDVFVSGDYAYVAAGSGLQILDVANKKSPTLLGEIILPDGALSVDVSGSYAYIAAGESGLEIIDISNPSFLTLVGSYNIPLWVGSDLYEISDSDVYVSGNYAYVAVYLADWHAPVHFIYYLQRIDVKNPSSPTDAGKVNTQSRASEVYVSGNYAYVAGSGGFDIVDISSPFYLSRAGSYDYGSTSTIFVQGKHACISNRGLQIVDVSNVSSPANAGRYVTHSGGLDAYVTRNYAYVAACEGGFRIIDVSNLSSPTFFLSLTVVE